MGHAATIKRDVPDHHCPICRHKCWIKKQKPPVSHTIGRPPTSQNLLINILEQEASVEFPFTCATLARRLRVDERTIMTYIYRMRNAGHVIYNEHRRGYWMDGPDTIK